MDFKGKVALVAGGARMGLTVARALADRGCSIVFTWRSSRTPAEKSVQTLLKTSGHKAIAAGRFVGSLLRRAFDGSMITVKMKTSRHCREPGFDLRENTAG